MNSDENKSDQPTPEELLKDLDAQLAKQRKRKQHAPAQRAVILMVGILLILGAVMIALVFARQWVEEHQDLKRPKPPATSPK
jgi:hypothetical protein